MATTRITRFATVIVLAALIFLLLAILAASRGGRADAATTRPDTHCRAPGGT